MSFEAKRQIAIRKGRAEMRVTAAVRAITRFWATDSGAPSELALRAELAAAIAEYDDIGPVGR